MKISGKNEKLIPKKKKKAGEGGESNKSTLNAMNNNNNNNNNRETEIKSGIRNNMNLRDYYNWKIKDYIEYMNLPVEDRDRLLYGKDIPSPECWKDYLASKLHQFMLWKQKGDLLGDIPKDLEPESLMIYIGYHGTITPAHKDIVGTPGHNLMVFGEPGAGAVWFCCARKDREKVAEFWKDRGQSIDKDNYFMRLRDLMGANFPIYVIEQQPEDLVLVPCDGPHQVFNIGGKSVKFAWNRLAANTFKYTLETLVRSISFLFILPFFF